MCVIRGGIHEGQGIEAGAKSGAVSAHAEQGNLWRPLTASAVLLTIGIALCTRLGPAPPCRQLHHVLALHTLPAHRDRRAAHEQWPCQPPGVPFSGADPDPSRRVTVATTSADALYRQGLDAMSAGDPESAIGLLAQACAIERRTDYSKALADACLDAADYSKALGAYADAIDLAPGHPEEFKLHANRGVCLEMLGRIDDALVAYLRALEL